LVGSACAWSLQRRGHRVSLLDPVADPAAGRLPALGVLMGRVFQRGSGRAWRLRQQSLALWRQWRRELMLRGVPLCFRPGLLLLAEDEEARIRQASLLRQPGRDRSGLEIWGPDLLARQRPALPADAVAGLYSPGDGWLEPSAARRALLADARRRGLVTVRGTARQLSRRDRTWRIGLAEGGALEAEWLVLCAGRGSADLLAGLGIERPLEPVLGQALALEIRPPPAAWTWPGAVVWRGINLVARADLGNGGGLWLGATLEPGREADPMALDRLRQLGDAAPAWLRGAVEVEHWQGIRPRPVGRPAPLLEVVAEGLLLADGHYRNGVLLTPASAAWVVEQVESGSETRGDPQPALNGEAVSGP
jgi:glycine/D-amino acid oxidase-like deaminating enzyme